MSTVLLHNGRLYADSQGTLDDGTKDFQTNKLFKIGHKRYGVTGNLGGWELFKGIKTGWNPLDRLAWWMIGLSKHKKVPCWVICVDDKKKKVYTYNHRWYGWKRYKFELDKLTHATMGSGTDYFDEIDKELFFKNELSPEFLITKSMKLDNSSGGRIVIM